MFKLISCYKYIFYYINKNFRFKFFFLFLMMLLVALLEVGSLASLVPFLQKILFVQEESKVIIFDNLFHNFSFYQENKFYFITSFFIGFIIMSLMIRTLMLKLMFSFVKDTGHFFASKIVNKVLDLSYIDFTRESSSKFITILETKTDRIIDLIYHALEILSSFVILSFIFVTLTLINAKITIVIFAFFLICYMILFKRYRKKITMMGHAYTVGLSNRVKIVQEIFGAFRLLKIDKANGVRFFNNQFLRFDNDIRTSLANLSFLSNFPRYLIEGIAIIVIASSAFILISQNFFEQETIVLSLGVAGFAGQRLLPMVQRIYYSSAYILAQKEPAYDAIEFLLNKNRTEEFQNDKEIKFNQTLTIKNVNFSYYSKKESKIFNDINLEIKKNSRVCILGNTGSGKSTFVDLIVGLLKPDSGQVLVDHKDIQEAMKSWQSKIAYVPQNTFLTDATILENIAFGVDIKKIDFARAEKAIEIAGIKNMIDKLPEKFSTKIGERGILLSGGQIQRLGLARAFYKDFEILILDESTNALDPDTEKLFYSNIKNEFKDKTIFSITHNEELSKNFDIVVELDQGKIKVKEIV